MPDEPVRDALARDIKSRAKGGNRGMGRGLSAILSVSPPAAAAEPATPGGEAAAGEVVDELRELPVELITPNPKQPRRRFEDEPLQALADSMRDRGILQPVLVRPVDDGRYELVAGERRWRAAQIAGLERIPALIRPRDDAETLEAALIENMAREDLNPVEEARACAALVEELGLTREGGRPAGGPLARGGVQPAAHPGPARRGPRAAGGRGSERGPRPRAPAGRGSRRSPLPGPQRRDRGMVGPGSGDQGPRDRPAGALRRDAGPPPPSGPRVHPDQAAAARDIADALSTALGHDVYVHPYGDGYRAELRLDSLDEALELARAIRG